MNTYKQVVSVYPTLDGRIRAESSGHQLNHLLGGTRWTHYPTSGFYEGNFNMRAIEKIKSRAEFYKDYWQLNLDPRLEHIFQEWKRWRDHLLLIKAQSVYPMLKLKYWKYDALRNYQTVDIQFLYEGGSIDALDMGLGKGLIKSTALITYNKGKIAASEIKIGDVLVTKNGETSKVTGVFPQGTCPVYRITFSDQTYIDCDEEHLWELNTPLRKWRQQPGFVKNTKWLLQQNLQDAAGNNKYFIPMCKPLNFSEKELPIDPYIIGYILGNGNLTQRSIRICIPDQETVDRIQSKLDADYELKFDHNYDYRLVHKTEFKNKYISILKDLKLWGCSANSKFIPDQYKFAQLPARIALLQGLMDSDGTIGDENYVTEFCTVSAQLIEDFVFLVQTLGGTATPRSRITHYNYDDLEVGLGLCSGQPSYRTHISLPQEIVNPFQLSRKARRYIAPTKYQPTRAIVSIEYLREDETICFSVDAPDKLFLIDHCIVTHNTVECCAVLDMWMMDNPDIKKILVVCPPNAIHTWKNHLLDWTQLERHDIMLANQSTQQDRIVPIVLGQRPETGRIVTITNWETLRLDACGKYLTEFTYDAIICDEVHRVRNPRAKQSKAFRKLKARRHPTNRFFNYKLECSGTTVVNYGTDLFPLVNWLHPDQYDDEESFREDFVDKPRTDIVKITKDGLKKESVDALTQELDYIMIERRKKEVLTELPEKIKEEILIPLNPGQRTKYNQMRDELITILETEDEGRNEYIEANVALAQIMRLKQLAVSPATIELAQRNFKSLNDVKRLDTMEIFNDDSAKLDWVMDFLDDLEDGEKVVIFSEFTSALALLEKRLLDAKYPWDYCVLTGDTKRIVYQQYPSAEELERQFQTDPKIRLWLGSLKASGEALTLTAANKAIMLDFWWNAATMQQAEDRIYRFGQTKAVTIYDLVAEDTIEKDIREIINEKAHLANTMLRSKKFLLELLKKDRTRE